MAQNPPLDPMTLAPPDTAIEPEQAGRVGYGSVLKHRDVRVLALSRAANKAAMSTISYGAMVHLGQVGASQLQISLVSASSYLAALLFGVQGGTISDSLSKRVALAAGQGIMAAMCFVIPSLLGTGAGDLMLLMFLSSMLMQVVSPGLKAAVALVATPNELAVTSALVSVIGSVASGLGSALLAPILIKVSNIETVLYVGGGLYLLGAIRSLAMPRERGRGTVEALRDVDWKPRALSLRANASWLLNSRAVATMILSGAIVVALMSAFSTLVPLYVREVLETDPANSVYIFAPAAVGYAIGIFLAPGLISRWGERRLATFAGLCTALSLTLFGLIDLVTPILAPISPLRLLELAGASIDDKVLAASVIAIPANFGSTASGAAVANYINRLVPAIRQGATFGLQETQENALILVTVIALGVVAHFTGPQIVMLISPILVVAVVLALLRYSYRVEGRGTLTRREALEILAEEDPDMPRDTKE